MENELIQLTKFVHADLTIIETKTAYNGDVEYKKTSFLFSENLFTIVTCDKDGNVERYRTKNYGACKLDGDTILFIDSSYGWLPHEAATKKWADIIVEKELLSETERDGKK